MSEELCWLCNGKVWICKLWFVLFYIYNHDVTLTLYINWTVFYTNIILIVTGLEVVIGNCLPEVHKILPDFRNWEEKNPIMFDDASCHLSCYTSSQRMRLSGTFTEIWCLKDNGVTTLTFWGHLTSLVTWPFDFRGSTSYGWSTVTMRLSGTVSRLKFFQEGSSRNRGRSLIGRSVGRQSVLNITLISYTPLRYVRNVART